MIIVIIIVNVICFVFGLFVTFNIAGKLAAQRTIVSMMTYMWLASWGIWWTTFLAFLHNLA